MELFSRIFQKEKSLEKRDEIYFLQNYRYKTLTADTKQKSCQKQVEPDIIKQLETLKAEYFITDIKRQRLSTNFVHGPLRRGFELWRFYSLWYLYKTLSKDCATRNGYCGRDCGCFEIVASFLPNANQQLGFVQSNVYAVKNLEGLHLTKNQR
ncbi:hypothetical protein N7450_011773 [Penicillium hetheringtonii]|uniref:Uncharacterized protein n=1 Tax=Penicillium hetheringtonii TaxID=911720 RepID=A0AAD6GNB0_9EURO|nr:hypothetical protein N7450_011773 [Penicillium hetheringtonii]